MQPVESVDIKAFIDARKVSAYQWLVLVLCFWIVMMDGLDTAVMGFVAPVIMRDWGVGRAAFGTVMSAAMVGLAIGALAAGPAADRFGRKMVVISSVFCFGIFTVCGSFADTPTQLIVLRFLTGLGLGAAMPNSTTLLSEYVPSRSRSLLLTIAVTGFNFGSGAGGFVAASLIPRFGWHSVFLFCGILPIASVPLLLWLLPESAQHMLVRKTPSERIATTLGRVCHQAFNAGAQFTSPEPAVTARASVRMLFVDGYAFSTVMLWVTYFMGLLIVYLLTGWLPTLIKDAGLPVERAAAITGMFQLGGTMGAVVVGFAMDRLDRNAVIGAAYLLGGVFIFALGTITLEASLLPFFVASAGFCISGAQTGLNALAPSCYPTRARATGVSWMLGIGRLGGILGSLFGGALLSLGFPVATVFSVLAVPAVIAALAIVTNRIAVRYITASVAGNI